MKEEFVGAASSRPHSQRGITLISLIITVIIMLILAGVVISIIVNGGLFAQAEEAKIATLKGQYHERLYAVTMAKYAEKRGKGEILTRDELKVILEDERENKREEWIAEGNKGIREIDPDDEKTLVITSIEGYIFHVIIHESGGIEVVDAGEGEPPKEVPTLDTDLETGNIKFIYTPNTWTNGNVIVTIETTIAGYEIEYSKTGTETDWLPYTTGVEYTANGIIYARLTDGYDVSNVATGNVEKIDKTNPVVGTITSTTNGATFNGTDTGSGIIAYGYSINSSNQPSSWTNITATTSFTNRNVTDLTANTNYYMWVKDQAGNTGNKLFTTKGVPLSNLQVGDYVNYQVGSPSTYTVPTSASGHSTSQFFDSGSYTGYWRVFYNDVSHGVQLISAESVAQLTLRGKTGYEKGLTPLYHIASMYASPHAYPSRLLTRNDLAYNSIVHDNLFTLNHPYSWADGKFRIDEDTDSYGTISTSVGINTSSDVGGVTYYLHRLGMFFDTEGQTVNLTGSWPYEYTQTHGIRPIVRLLPDVTVVDTGTKVEDRTLWNLVAP